MAEPQPNYDEPDTHDELPLNERLLMIVNRLQLLADEQVAKKSNIETRWEQDLRQYYGRYKAETEAKLKAANKSEAFVRLTRSKTHAWRARLADLLFPTDDKNWGISPTPVPELTEEARKAAVGAAEKKEQSASARAAGLKAPDPDEAANPNLKAVNENDRRQSLNNAQNLARQSAELTAAGDKIREQLEEASLRAKAMEREIEDQFVEARYNVKSREAIRNMTKLGTGIMKGPLNSQRSRARWTEGRSEGKMVRVLEHQRDERADWACTDPWNFFPDMAAAWIEDAEFTFERHPANRKQFLKLAREIGFFKNAVKRLKEKGATGQLPTFIPKLREISGLNQESGAENQYIVWEYHGPLTRSELELIAEISDDAELLQALDDDPTEQPHVIVWFCQDELLAIEPHPSDSGDTLYSVSCFEDDDSSIFGFGVPWLMRDSQASLNGAWRMTMDNGGLSSGPQVVINRDIIEPQNGSWVLTPRKVWIRKAPETNNKNPAFEMHEIACNQAELDRIIERALQFIDDEVSLPLVAQGEQGARANDTFGGMTLLMNAANVVFRDVVKSWDDHMTTPNVRRAYDWNMMFNPDDSIKGDYETTALGSSVLLVREVQATNLMVLADRFSVHPVFGPMTKAAALYRKMVQAHMVKSDEVVKTDEEMKAEAAAKEPEIPIEIQREQVRLEGTTVETSARITIAQLQRDTALMTLAENRNMTIDEIEGKLAAARIAAQAKTDVEEIKQEGSERRMDAEIGVQATQPQTSPTGAGGHV